MSDEVQTGFGRTGKLFGVEHYGVSPDMLCLAKAIANGLPLGAYLARADIADSFKPGDHLSTFGGNPVCCAATLVNIEFMLEEELPAKSQKNGEYTKARLDKLSEKHELIGDARGI